MSQEKQKYFTFCLPNLQQGIIWSKLHTFVWVNSSLFKFKQAEAKLNLPLK